MYARLASALLICLIAGCASQREALAPTERPAQPVNFPTAFYLEANARGEPVYRIDSEQSQLMIRVYRAGSLARFGHDHVAASRDLHGYALWPKDFRDARGDIYVAVDTFRVDEPALRAQARLDTQPSEADIEGTRRNMRKALEADAYPFVTVHLVPATEESAGAAVQANVTLHGVTRTFSVPVELETPNGPAFYAKGRFSVRQTDFGIQPFSVMGGALQVQDEFDVEFHLALSRLPH